MKDYSAIYLLTISWCQICDLIQTSCSDFWPRLCNETSGLVFMLRHLVEGWYVAFAMHASHPMPGRNYNRYYYPLLTSFVCSFVRSFVRADYSLRSASGPRRNSSSDKSRTHIQPFIRTRPRKPTGSSRVISRSSILALLPQDICCDVTLPPGRPGRSWCWRPKGQAWPRPASRLLTTLLVAPLPVAFLCRAWGYSSRSTTTRFGKALVCK